jgi:DNA-directed RNA polymerase specialized sigma24 family protein
MSSDGSVTHWFEQLKQGDSIAARAIWERYFPELVRLARDKLRGTTHVAADEEDVALSALDSFFHAAQGGRFPDLADRHDLWRVLLQMTVRKVVDLKRHETRQRRGGGRLRLESVLERADADLGESPLAQVVGDTPTPEFAAMMAEECGRLLGVLTDPSLRSLAVAKMEGYTNREIAERSDCSLRTVERRLGLIRKKWQQERPP